MKQAVLNLNAQSSDKYDSGNDIIYNKQVLKSSLCYNSDNYILVRGNITVVGDNGTQVAFKNCAPFTKCITNRWNNS